MKDERLLILAKNLVNYSCEVQPGEKVLVEIYDCDDAIGEMLVEEIYKAGGIPFVNTTRTKIQREWLMHATKEQIQMQTEWDAKRMQEMNAYIAFRGNNNTFEMADVPTENLNLYQSIYSKRVHTELRVKHTKWVVLRYPNDSMAQMSSMSTAQFEDLYFKVCNLDYRKMSLAMDAIVKRMEKADQVRITAPGTDLTFSIKGIPPIKCAGKMNIPDGEIYTAPVRDSVNGTIAYNTSSITQGFRYENVSLTFQDGKIVDAKANDTKRINDIFDTDEGARYVGEFAIGVNPYITKPMGDILFDEKITGSIHFTPGNAYDDADNENRSAVHWDLVLIQTPEWGGGEIYFDGELIRKDGLFVTEDLQNLNPEHLK